MSNKFGVGDKVKVQSIIGFVATHVKTRVGKIGVVSYMKSGDDAGLYDVKFDDGRVYSFFEEELVKVDE